MNTPALASTLLLTAAVASAQPPTNLPPDHLLLKEYRVRSST